MTDDELAGRLKCNSWHNLLKCQTDLPDEGGIYLVAFHYTFRPYTELHYDVWRYTLSTNTWYDGKSKRTEVVAWMKFDEFDAQE